MMRAVYNYSLVVTCTTSYTGQHMTNVLEGDVFFIGTFTAVGCQDVIVIIA